MKRQILATLAAALALACLSAPDAVARGFGGGGIGWGMVPGPSTAPIQPIQPLPQPLYPAYGFGWNPYYYGGLGAYGGGEYYEDPAEQAYDSSHYWDGSLRQDDRSAPDDAGPNTNAPPPTPTPAPTVTEAQRLQAADQTYHWGFDKAARANTAQAKTAAQDSGRKKAK